MKSMTSLSLVLASYIASTSVTAVPVIVTVLNPAPVESSNPSTTVFNTALSSAGSVIMGGTDANGHTTFIASETDGVGTIVAGASYLSAVFVPQPTASASASGSAAGNEFSFECTAIDASMERCILGSSALTTTQPYAQLALDVTSTLAGGSAEASGASGETQKKPNSAGAGSRTGIAVILSSAVLSGLGLRLV